MNARICAVCTRIPTPAVSSRRVRMGAWGLLERRSATLYQDAALRSTFSTGFGTSIAKKRFAAYP